MFRCNTMISRVRRWPNCLLVLSLCGLFSFAAAVSSARAAITPTGDVSPSDPSTWTSATNGFIGNTASGTVTIDGGSDLVSSVTNIAHASGTTGVVNVTGLGSTWIVSDSLVIGNSGSGTLSISGGGSVSSHSSHINNNSSYIGKSLGSTGAVTVDGAGSSWVNLDNLDVGYYGSGTLSITGGGSADTGSTCIGLFSAATGIITVDGAGSTWTASNFYVGVLGNGTLSVTAGGRVNSDGCDIGYHPGSTGIVTVDGGGSTWAINSIALSLFVGNSGGGTLSITGGGSVSNQNRSNMGYAPGSTGLVTVDGSGSTWTNNRDL
jgi:T5SS/PEP-CTERM-associated repeat protein